MRFARDASPRTKVISQSIDSRNRIDLTKDVFTGGHDIELIAFHTLDELPSRQDAASKHRSGVSWQTSHLCIIVVTDVPLPAPFFCSLQSIQVQYEAHDPCCNDDRNYGLCFHDSGRD